MNTPRKDYQAALPKWKRARHCYEGTDAVKGAGIDYLPMLDSHSKGITIPPGDAASVWPGALKYEAYKLRALFYNAMGRTVDGLSGAIFQKAPALKMPERIRDHAKDVTLTGASAELFGLRTTREVLTTGRYGVLVEMAGPDAPEQRPYWAGYRAEDVIAWRTERRGGDLVLTCVVLRENIEEQDPKDEFATTACEQYRVLMLAPGKTDSTVYTQQIWRKAEGGDKEKPTWVVVDEAIPSRRAVPLDFIPFVFIGPTSTAADIEKPPLVDLADVNLSHYRNMADLEHGLHHVGVPQLVISGNVAGGNSNGPLDFGSGVAICLDTGGDAKILQADGELLGALERADERKRKLMATLGARLLEEQAGAAETATAVGMRHSGEHATLRTVAQAIEQGLTMALQWHVWWMGTEATPEDTKATYELNKEFFAVKASPDEVRAALLAWQAGGISFETFYERLQKGGWSREGVTAEEELRAIEAETPPVPEALVDADPNAPPAPGSPPQPPPVPPTPPPAGAA